ncbi:MAG: MarR family transcriptional regulator [Saprospiraceae bacterium]|nr:MarR family transcriptional regulator [Saprospiraceae bacterium]
MDWQEGRDKFLQAWGTLGTEWGINRTMAQIHALMLISPRPLSADEVMEELQISRGNANMNIRALMDWGLVYKELRAGDRREYFIAEKDMWKVVRQIIVNRKKRELEPILKILDEISGVDENGGEEAQALVKAVNDIKLFSSKADATLDMLVKADSNWFVGTFMKMIK